VDSIWSFVFQFASGARVTSIPSQIWLNWWLFSRELFKCLGRHECGDTFPKNKFVFYHKLTYFFHKQRNLQQNVCFSENCVAFRGLLTPNKSLVDMEKKNQGILLYWLQWRHVGYFNIFLFGPLQSLPKSTESVHYSDGLNQKQSLYFTDLFKVYVSQMQILFHSCYLKAIYFILSSVYHCPSKILYQSTHILFGRKVVRISSNP
jgi:hypothetical protein